MEDNLNSKIKEIAGSQPGITGVMIVDRYGLAVESFGSLQATRGGLISSIMRNVTQIARII